MSWSNISNEKNDGLFSCSLSYLPLKFGVEENTNVTTWYWLNVPPTYSGIYNGSIYIKGVRNGESP
jgi:hypothetical protein